MRRTHFSVDQDATVRGSAAMSIRASLLIFAAAVVAMTSAVSPASAKLKCLKWMPLTQSQRCVQWAEVSDIPKNGKYKHPCSFGQKC